MSTSSLINYIKFFRQSKFIKNIIAVATGVAAAQAISLAFMPILTRLYGPEDFGALAAFIAIINIITPLATLGYANAIVMPKNEEDANAVIRLSLFCTIIIFPIVLIFVFLFKKPLALLIGLENHSNLLYFIPISLIFVSLLSVAEQVAIRKGLFNEKASAYVISTFMMNIGKLFGGYIAPSSLTLIILMIFSKFFNFLILLLKLSKINKIKLKKWFGLLGINKAAKKQKDFAIYRMPQSILNAASLGLPVIVLTNLFGGNIAGQYSITVMLISAPVMLLGNAILDVFFPKITELFYKNPNNAYIALKKSTLVLTCIGLVPFGLIIILGELIFPWGLGADWVKAGEYSKWISLWMFSVLISRPAVAAIPVLKLQGILLIYEITITSLRVAGVYLGASIGNDLTAIVIFSLINVIGYLSLLFIVIKKCREM